MLSWFPFCESRVSSFEARGQKQQRLRLFYNSYKKCRHCNSAARGSSSKTLQQHQSITSEQGSSIMIRLKLVPTTEG